MIPVNVIKKLLPAISAHRQVEAKISALLQEKLATEYIKKKKPKFETLHYLQRNFFSILFLSIYQSLGIGKKECLFYGIINHCLRGIVTGTDNLLDNEYKEMLRMNFPADAEKFKSVMHILLFDRFLFDTIRNAVKQRLIPETIESKLQQHLFDNMVPIGAEEAQEEGGVSDVFSPAEILQSVHMYKGGHLLCLAFVAPKLLETERKEAVLLARKGIYCIGMALQVIDDLTDLYEDIENRNHNYLLSVIRFEGNDTEQKTLDRILTNKEPESPVELLFPETTTVVMERAIGEALMGFHYLEQAGYWLDKKNAMALIRFIFKIRGVKNLLKLLPALDKIQVTLTNTSE